MLVPNIKPGLMHQFVEGKFERFLKCSYCDLSSIHGDAIAHIQSNDDVKHDLDLNQLDYIVSIASKQSPYGPCLSIAELKLPWIKCLWCDYRDKIEFDLSLHFLEKHKNELMTIPITRQERLAAKVLSGDWFAKFERPMEFRLDKAVKMAREKSGELST